ncbi:MAG: hypothetical protein JW797_18750 [Bradymonadales bacterium]|nr:hypothetical protein [Bradymonadales bacterium]
MSEVRRDTLLEVIAVGGDWSRIIYRDVRAFVLSADLSEDLQTTSEESPDAGPGTDAGRIRDLYANGLNVGFFRDNYATGSRTIRNNSHEWSRVWNGIGLGDSGQLTIGQSTRALSVQELVSKTNTIVNAVRRILSSEMDEAAIENSNYLKIRNLAISVHGEAGAIMLTGLGGEAGEPVDMEQVRTFVDSLSAYLTSDVRVHLFACNAARNPGQSNKEATRAYGEEAESGEGSFASSLRADLAAAGHEETQVAGHTIKGHTTRNRFVRFFGGIVGDDLNGADAINIIFLNDEFMAEEMARLLGEDASEDQVAEFYPVLRGKLDDFYTVMGRPSDDYSYVQIARDIMMNPAGCRDTLRDFWRHMVPSAEQCRSIHLVTRRHQEAENDWVFQAWIEFGGQEAIQREPEERPDIEPL